MAGEIVTETTSTGATKPETTMAHEERVNIDPSLDPQAYEARRIDLRTILALVVRCWNGN